MGGPDAPRLAVREDLADGLDHVGLAHLAGHVADFDSGADHVGVPKDLRMNRILSRSKRDAKNRGGAA